MTKFRVSTYTYYTQKYMGFVNKRKPSQGYTMNKTIFEVVEMKRTLANRLAAQLRLKGLSPYTLQERVAELVATGKLQTGVSAPSIYTYMNGASLPTKSKLEAIAAGLEIPAEDLLPDAEMISDARRKRSGSVKYAPALIAARRTKGGGLGTLELHVKLVARLDPTKATKAAEQLRKFCDMLEIPHTDGGAT